MPQLIIIMGVSGTGKSTIGRLLSKSLQLPFHDADDFHPEANVRKMREGNPLNDLDRAPWLQLLSDKLQEWSETGAILACSALKATYREILGKNGQLPLRWIHLIGSIDIIRARMQARKDHFMPDTLLQSQFDALEVPDEAIAIDIGEKPEILVEEILKQLNS